MNIRKSSVLVMLTALILNAFSCKREKEEEPETFDRIQMLKNITTEVILPSYSEFLSETETLENKINAFNSDLTTHSFNELKIQWALTTITWEKCELYNLGSIQSSFIHNKIDTWPSNTTFIENFIASSDELTSDYLNSKGSSSKGLPAMEYLLYGDDQNPDAQFTSLTTAENSDRRRAYLTALTQNVNAKAEEVLAKWTDHYQFIFTSDSSTELGSSISVLVNELISVTEQVAQTKLAKPMGKTSDGLPHPNLLEAYRSGQSLQKMKSNLLSIKEVLFGKESNSQNFLADYANFTESDMDAETALTSKIQTQFNVIEATTNSINPPLNNALENQYDQLNDLYEKIRYLFILLNVDLSNDLGIVVTLNINDGD